MAVVGQLQATADVGTRQEQEDAFCELMRFIREDREACELTGMDSVVSVISILYIMWKCRSWKAELEFISGWQKLDTYEVAFL